MKISQGYSFQLGQASIRKEINPDTTMDGPFLANSLALSSCDPSEPGQQEASQIRAILMPVQVTTLESTEVIVAPDVVLVGELAHFAQHYVMLFLVLKREDTSGDHMVSQVPVKYHWKY